MDAQIAGTQVSKAAVPTRWISYITTQPQRPADHRRLHLRPAKPRRALLFKTQAQSTPGHPLR